MSEMERYSNVTFPIIKEQQKGELGDEYQKRYQLKCVSHLGENLHSCKQKGSETKKNRLSQKGHEVGMTVRVGY